MSESTEEPTPTHIVCMPVADGEPPVPSTTMTCERCDEYVWVSEAVAPRVIYGGLAVMCIMCWYPIHLEQGTYGQIPDEARADLRRLGIEKIAEAATAALNADGRKRKARGN